MEEGVKCFFCHRVIELSEARHPAYKMKKISDEWVCKDVPSCDAAITNLYTPKRY